MLKLLRVVVLIAVSQSLISSCILVQEEENFVVVEETSNPDFRTIPSYSYDHKNYFPLKDTLWVSNQLNITWHGGIPYDVEVTINGTVLVPFGNGFGNLLIQKSHLPNQNNTVIIRQHVKTGSGSLADKAGIEYAEYEDRFVAVRDDGAPFVPVISAIAFQDGTVRIDWNKYKRSDFQSYKIIKSVSTGSTYKEYRTLEVNDRQQNFLLDTTYVGGTINYKLEVSNGGSLTSAVYPFNYTYKPQAVLTKAGTTFTLSYTAPPFYKNVKFYKTLFYSVNPTNNTTAITNVNVSPENLSMNMNGPVWFGLAMKYEVYPVAKVDVSQGYGDEILSSGLTTYGIKTKLYDGWYEHDVNSPYYFCYVNNSGGPNGMMYKISDTDFKAVDSVSFPGGVNMFTRNGQMLISPDGNNHYWLVAGTGIIKFNPVNLSVISTTPWSSISNPPFGGFDISNRGTTVTNNNRIYFSGSDRGSFPCVVDLNTTSTIFIADNRNEGGSLSKDGKFLVVGLNVYKYSAGVYTLNHTLTYGINNGRIPYREFIRSSSSELLIFTGNAMIIHDCETQTQIYSSAAWQIDYNAIAFDHTSNKVVSDFHIFDIPTRTFKDVPVYQYNSFFSGNIFFSNNVLNSTDYALKDY